MAGPLTLSMRELDRLQVLTRIGERRLTRRRAAGLLQTPGTTPLSRVRPGRRRGARVAPARSSEPPPAPGRDPGARPGPHPRALRRLRAHVRPPEAHRGARPRPVRRDAARLDECRRPVGPAGPARPPELSAAGAPGLPRRARPARWQRARLVRGSWPALHVAGLRRR